MENSTSINPKSVDAEIADEPSVEVVPQIAGVDLVQTQLEVDPAPQAVESPENVPADASPIAAPIVNENPDPLRELPIAPIPAGALHSRPPSGTTAVPVPTPAGAPATSELGQGSPAAPPA
jgi:hypothetical protein